MSSRAEPVGFARGLHSDDGGLEQERSGDELCRRGGSSRAPVRNDRRVSAEPWSRIICFQEFTSGLCPHVRIDFSSEPPVPAPRARMPGPPSARGDSRIIVFPSRSIRLADQRDCASLREINSGSQSIRKPNKPYFILRRVQL